MLMKERCPIVGSDLIQRVDHVIEGVGLELGAVVGSAVEEMAEVVDGLLAVGHVVNDGGGFKPHQIAFLVVVGGAAPVRPAADRER